MSFKLCAWQNYIWACSILVQVKIYRRLRIGRDDHLDQSEAYHKCQVILTDSSSLFEHQFRLWSFSILFLSHSIAILVSETCVQSSLIIENVCSQI